MRDSTASSAPPGLPRRGRESHPTVPPRGAALHLLAGGTSAGLEPGRGRVKAAGGGGVGPASFVLGRWHARVR